MLKLDGLEQKSVENILNAIENSKKKPLANLLTALGIPLLSSVKAQKLTKFYSDLTIFLTAVKNEEWEKIRRILGEETQKEIKNYLQVPHNWELIKNLNEIFK